MATNDRPAAESSGSATAPAPCTWDRALDPNRPPKHIDFAEGTEDEMCFSTYALIPDATG